MFGFGKQKKATETDLAPELVRAMRTMEDDITNVPLPSNTEVVPADPPMDVSTNPAQGVPFYAAAETNFSESAPQGESPFLNDAAPLAQEGALPGAAPTQAQATAVLPMTPPEIARPFVPGERTSSSGTPVPMYRQKRFLIMGAVSIGVLLIIGLGTYWWFGRDTEPPMPPISNNDVVPPVNPPVVPPTVPIDLPILDQTKRFTSDQPNIFSLDTETATAEGLRTELLKLAAEVKRENPKTALEFVVRDQNYNPLAFTRFSYLLGVAFPETLLVTLDEAFSLYVVIDADRPRLGLSVVVKDMPTFTKELQKAEKTLPQAITPLFIDTTTAPKSNLLFRSGSYRGFSTRFANVDSTLGLSVDYVLTSKEWFIGTSQMTLRALLDKVAADLAQATSDAALTGSTQGNSPVIDSSKP